MSVGHGVVDRQRIVALRREGYSVRLIAISLGLTGEEVASALCWRPEWVRRRDQ